MNKPKCSEYLYVQFLIAAQKNFTCTELSKVSPENTMAHDAATRMLAREKLTPNILWKNTKHCVDLNSGYLIVDDTLLEKASSKDTELVHWQYSGARHGVIRGIGLVNLLWTNNNGYHIPVDFRIYDKPTDGKTKNDHFQDMIRLAHHRGIKPEYVLFDSWYASVSNLKLLDRLNFQWITQLPKSRVVSTAPKQYCNLEKLDIPEQGLKVHLKAYGFIEVFKKVSKERGIEYFATNDMNLSKSDVERIYSRRWKVEEYHQGLKQQCGAAKCQARKQRSLRNHIWCSIHAFVSLEMHRIQAGITWQEAKLSIARESIYQYLLAPRFDFMFSTA